MSDDTKTSIGLDGPEPPDPTGQFPRPPDDDGPQSGRTESRILRIRNDLLRKLQSADPTSILEWTSGVFQNKGSAAFYGKILTVVVCSFFFADLAALLLGRYIPEPPPVRLNRPGAMRKSKSIDEYAGIFGRNLFSSRGLIPGDDAAPGGVQDMGGPPVRTTLPFNLIGTLILRDEIHSIATIEDKSASTVYPVRIDDEIPTKAKILKIEKNKVTFVNTSSGRREYVDIPEDLMGNGPKISLGTSGRPGGGTGIDQVANNQFNIARGEVDKALSDLNNILTQARAVPNFENGLPSGYKLFQIVPGSIYDKLGLRNGDVIAGFDGQPANDPAKAWEALSGLKERSHLDLQVKRDGKTQTFSYDIR